MKTGRPPEPPLLDPAHDPRREVGLAVAARYLGLHERALRRRLEEGLLPAWRDGKVYRIAVAALVRYRRSRRESSI